MQLRKTAIPGRCAANRCVKEATVTPENPHGLCNQHYNEWMSAGSPDLAAPAAPTKAPSSKNADLEVTKAEITPLRDALDRALNFVATVGFEDATPFGTGLEALGKMRETARQQFKLLEEKRTTLNRPVLDLKRMHDALFKPALDQCEAVQRACTERLEAYERARMLAQRAAALQVSADPLDPSVLSIAHHAAAPLPEEVSARVVFKYEIVDFAQVPREFLLLNDRLVMHTITDRRGQLTIPGLRIFEDVKVVASGRAPEDK
jgi:hypothetical protein